MPQRRKPNPIRPLTGEAPKVHPVIGGPLGTPDPPEWLPDAGQDEWRRVVQACSINPGWLQHGDVAMLTAYCATWATWLEAAQDVAARGPLVPGRSSADGGESGPRLVKNPAAQVARDAASQLRYLCRELGFSPDSRAKVDTGTPDGSDPDADLLTG